MQELASFVMAQRQISATACCSMVLTIHVLVVPLPYLACHEVKLIKLLLVTIELFNCESLTADCSVTESDLSANDVHNSSCLNR